MLPQVGPEGQRRLKNGSVLIVGAGGLGAPMAQYLAAAGVGHIGIVDADSVELSNLQRQVLFSTEDVGELKVLVAARRLRALNPHVEVTPHPIRLDRSNALDTMAGYDVIADGTDNFATRYLLNDASVLLGKPDVYGSIFRFEGQATVFGAPGGPCYRCLYSEPPAPGDVPSCAEGGVLGVLPGLIGTIQATEVLKLLLGSGTTLAGRLLLFDALAMRAREIGLRRDPACPVCGDNPSIRELIDYEDFCGLPPADLPSVSPRELWGMLEASDPPALLDVRSRDEFDVENIGGDLIPLPELAARLEDVEPLRARRVVVICRSGARSAEATALLRAAGFPRVFNLEGGLNAWRREVGGAPPPGAR